MLDSVEITVFAGRGGKGSVAFRREKFVPRGGPAGGDGGRGANVVLVGDASLSTLDAYRFKRTYKAEAGGHGGGSKRHGRSAAVLELRMPVGTEVWLEARERGVGGPRELLGDLREDGLAIVVAEGSRYCLKSSKKRFCALSSFPLIECSFEREFILLRRTESLALSQIINSRICLL